MRIKVHLRGYATKKDRRRWLLIVREPGRAEQYITLGAISKREAEERRIVTLNELLNGSYKRGPSVRLFFGEFCDRVLSEYITGTRAPRTLELYRESLVPVRRGFEGWWLDQIRRRDLETFLSELRLANRSKNIILSALRVIFRKAVEWDYLKESPAEKIIRWKEDSQGSKTLSAEELGLALDRASSWAGEAIKVMVYSGLRPGELSQLKFEDINWSDHVIRVVSDRQRKTKNRKSRVIPMSPDLERQLRFLSDNWPNMQHGSRDNGNLPYLPRHRGQKEYVFCHRDGRPVKSFRRGILNAFHKAGIRGVTPHGLRKTFCTLLARSGVHPKVAQKLMGHSDVRLTMDIYTEVGDDQLRSAVAGLPTLRDLKRQKFSLVGSTVE